MVARAFTTDAIAGLLVVLITVLIVNQVLRLRQQRDRFRATAAHAALLLSQANRATRAVLACATSADRTAASDELRTYMIMLMIGAPILIDSKIPRALLEDAQRPGACAPKSDRRSREVPCQAPRLTHSSKKRWGSSR